MDRRYFLEPSETFSKRRKREITDQIRKRDDVVDLMEDYPRIRKKRDYIEGPVVSGPIEKRQANFLFKNALPVPKLPFIDPFYEDQWYLVIFVL